MIEMVNLDGGPIPEGQTLSVDHHVREFKVVIRSMNRISPEGVKDFLQRRWEVLECEVTGGKDYVVVGMPD